MISNIHSFPVQTRYEIINIVSNNSNTSQTNLSRMLGLSRPTIKKALDWSSTKQPFPARGRPKALKDHHLMYIEARTLSNRLLSNAQLAKEMVEVFDDINKLHETTVLRARHSLKLHWLPARSNCAVSEQSRRTRVSWCQKQQEIELDWTHVVFSDESWFELGSNHQWLWRHYNDYGPDVMIDKKAHREKVMVWGAIGEGFKSDLLFIEGNVTGDYYFDNIICGGFLEKADKTYGYNNWLFQQDNARPHIKKSTLEAMSNLDIRLLEGWPPYSPDLNIIETVWAIMKRRVNESRPKTKIELKMIISKVWEELTLETIHGLVAEMPNRLVQVIASNGYTIQHI